MVGAWWTAGLSLVAALALAAAPTQSARIAQTLRERTGVSLLIVFAALLAGLGAIVLQLMPRRTASV